MENECPHSMMHFCSNLYSDNGGLNSSRHHDDIPYDVEVLLFALTCVVVPLGLLGNALVVYVVGSKKDMRTVCNIIVANLAVRDIVFLGVVGISEIVFHGKHFAHGENQYVKPVTAIIVYGLTVTMMATSGFLVALAHDRYRSIGQPMTSRTRKSVVSATISCTVIWIVSLLLCIIHTVIETEQRQLAWLVIIVTLSIIAYVFPLMVVIGCYAAILIAVRSDQAKDSGEQWNHLTRWEFRRKIRVLRMVAYVIIVFSLSWGLWFGVGIYVAVKMQERETLTTTDQILLAVTDLSVFSASAINPFIYGLTNANFKRHYKAVLCMPFSPRSLRHITTTPETTGSILAPGTKNNAMTLPSDQSLMRLSMIKLDDST